MTEAFTLYKLIVLYMLRKVDFPMTTSQISGFILDKGYTSYFKLQEALSEMVDSGLLQIETTHNRTLYHLTEDGAKTIHFFQSKISPAIQDDINVFFKEKTFDLEEEVSAKSNYRMNSAHEFEVHCQLLESGNSLLDLVLTVPTKTEAEAIANNWGQQNQEVYALLLSKLL